jgi:hypothetical protein
MLDASGVITMSDPKASDGWITLPQARQRLGLAQVADVLHLLIKHQITPRRRRGCSSWYLSERDLRRLARLTRAGSTRP